MSPSSSASPSLPPGRPKEENPPREESGATQPPARGPFLSPAALAARLASANPPTLLAVGNDGVLPPAIHPASHATELSSHYASAGGADRGRLPLPDPADVRAWLARLGIADGIDLVVYDNGGGSQAARAWWVLSWIGHYPVAILDGGEPAWRAFRQHGDSAQATDDLTDLPRAAFLAVDTDDIADDPARYRLFDARATAAYAGNGITPSHLPGAVSSPAAAWQDSDGRLLPRAQREAKARALGLLDASGAPVVAYCGSGVAAAYWIAAVADLGVRASLYAGSWSAWSARFHST